MLLSTGTPWLHWTAGKLLITPAMFVGRLGTMTLVLALARRGEKATARIKYPRGNIMVG